MRPTDLAPHFIGVCPSFADVWRAHHESPEWEPLPYMDVGALARHIVDLHRSGRTSELPAVFDEIERLFTAEPDLRELLVIGLIEGLQKAGDEAFDAYMGDQTRTAWGQLNEFWSHVEAGKRDQGLLR